jgi:beta-glucanase (GH16 family)
MKKSSLVVSFILSCAFPLLHAQQAASAMAQPEKPSFIYSFGKTPVFSDEFEYSGKPDPASWGYDLGASGWGNNELQDYTADLENASVENGLLTITARKSDGTSPRYTSARLVTKNKGDLLYGRVEVRAKLPAGRGTWPAIWMLPTDWEYGEWPRSGEIDIMEHVGYDPDVIHFSTHCLAYYFRINTQKTAEKKISSACTEFHVYRLDWTPETITGFIDDELIFTSTNEKKSWETWPFDKRFHLLLNIAVGGDWGGAKGVDETIFPASMQVDYVRFYPLIKK